MARGGGARGTGMRGGSSGGSGRSKGKGKGKSIPRLAAPLRTQPRPATAEIVLRSGKIISPPPPPGQVRAQRRQGQPVRVAIPTFIRRKRGFRP